MNIDGLFNIPELLTETKPVNLLKLPNNKIDITNSIKKIIKNLLDILFFTISLEQVLVLHEFLRIALVFSFLVLRQLPDALLLPQL